MPQYNSTLKYNSTTGFFMLFVQIPLLFLCKDIRYFDHALRFQILLRFMVVRVWFEVSAIFKNVTEVLICADKAAFSSFSTSSLTLFSLRYISAMLSFHLSASTNAFAPLAPMLFLQRFMLTKILYTNIADPHDGIKFAQEKRQFSRVHL